VASPKLSARPTQREIAVQPGLTTGPKLTRGLGTATEAAVGVGAMPAIQQHLQKRGQNLQTWSASRDQGFNQLHQQIAPRLAQFQQNREKMWNQLSGHAADHARMARAGGADWQNYRRDLRSFRSNRAEEIRDRIRDGYDDLFTYDWWNQRHGRNFPLGDYSPWWWWNPSPWNTVDSFGGFGWNQPIYYDYDTDAVADGDIYVDGQDQGPSAAYAQQVIQLANPAVAVEEPAPVPSAGQPDEWQPFGVFALTQEEKGDAIMFFQLAMNKEGLISGAFTNTLTGDSAAVTGSIDKTTQRAAWHVGDKTDTVYEAGVANLTQDVAPILIHFGTQTTQTWLLVHLASPDLPVAPNSAGIAPPQ